MATWDKIRAAAQRPDCIFSAFPDGEAGAMYHPRASADEILQKTTSNVQIANGAFETTNTGSGCFYDSGFQLGGRKHDITLIAKFTIDIPAGEYQYFVGPLVCGGVGGSNWGLVWQAGKQTFDGEHFSMLANCWLSFTRTDGSTGSMRITKASTELVRNEWYTMAMTIPVTQIANNGKFDVYVNGTNIYSFVLKNNFSNWTTVIPDSIATALPDVGTRVNEVIWYTGYTLKTKWAMVFNRCLSAEEIKYLSED